MTVTVVVPPVPEAKQVSVWVVVRELIVTVFCAGGTGLKVAKLFVLLCFI